MTSFEGRLADLFDVYADGAPVDVDEKELRDAIRAARKGLLSRILGSHLGDRPWLVSVLLLALMLIALVATVFVGAMLITHMPGPVKPLSIRPTAFMTQQRTGAVSVRLAGDRVLVLAGHNSYPGGNRSFGEIYDPTLRTFRTTGSGQAFDLIGGSATVLRDGRVVYAGGADETGQPTRIAVMYDADAGTFARLPDMGAARAGHAAALLEDGRVALVGGLSEPAPSTAAGPAVEYFDPQTSTFTVGADPQPLRHDAQVAFALNDGRLLIFRLDAPLWSEAVAEAGAITLDLATSELKPASMSHPPRADVMRVKSAALLADHRIAVVVSDASAGSASDALMLFDPSTGSFSDSVLLGGALAAAPVALTDGRILIGEHPLEHCGDVFADVFDRTDGSFKRIGQIGGIGGCAPRLGVSVTALADGSALLAGGYMGSGQDTSAASVVRP